MATFEVLALGGDGIGPEVTDAALRVLDAAAGLSGIVIDVSEDLLHGACWEKHGTFCRDETVEKARSVDAILVGAVGGPEWDTMRVKGPPEQQDGLMRLRKELDTFAGLRPAHAIDCLTPLTPYRDDVVSGADILVLREMCGGAFFASPRGVETNADGQRVGHDTTRYTEAEIARLAHTAFRLAKRRNCRLCSADKANVMESGKLWRAVVTEVAEHYADVEARHMYADNVSYQIAIAPRQFDVIIGDNLFGDILSDQAGALAGSLGMLPSACLPGLPAAGKRTNGIYEPVHGSAPDIAGQDIANPLGAILSVAMMFEYSFADRETARRIEAAVTTALEAGHRTADLGGNTGTAAMTDAVISELRS